MNITAFGDSILKGVRYKDGKYSVNPFWEEKLSREFDLPVSNRSRFGATIRKALPAIRKTCEPEAGNRSLVLIEFGGNDCDYDWTSIAEDPEGRHLCKTPIEQFVADYRVAVTALRNAGHRPVALSLPPILSGRYLDFICRNGLSRTNILKWLGSEDMIERWQNTFSDLVVQIAREERIELIDLRSVFPESGHKLKKLLCEDGLHPNTNGQELIYQTLRRSAKAWASC